MQNFARRTALPAVNVESKNINPDDFKIKLPRTKLLGKDATRPTTDSAHQVMATPPATGQEDERDVFGTDAGSIDSTTTDLHEHRADPHESQYVRELSSDPDRIEYGPDEIDEEEEEDFDEHNVPDVILYRVDGQDHSVSRQKQPDLHSQVALAISRKKATPVNPPSYPATTSGEPSIVAPDEDHLYHQDQQYAVVPQREPITTAHNGTWHKENLTAVGHQSTWQPGFAIQMQHVQQPQRQQESRPHAENGMLYERDLPGRPQSQIHRQEVVVAQRTSDINRKHNHRNPNHHRHSSRNVDVGQATPTKTPASRGDAAAGKNIETGALEPQLDHEKAKLFKMDFAALQAEDYDVDPCNPSETFQNGTTDELNDHLVQFSKNHTEQQQKNFFASLSIEQWEQAGDWFQDQFADMFRRMKENRREKRKVSYEFEAKIAQRHETVLKKRQLTEDALSAMKGAGAHVLDTPKKMKQKR